MKNQREHRERKRSTKRREGEKKREISRRKKGKG